MDVVFTLTNQYNEIVQYHQKLVDELTDENKKSKIFK